MVIDIKMCRFDNVPWGFRLVGGSDFDFPLTVVKVNEGSIAEDAGLKVGDIIVRVNDTAVTPLTHDEVNKIILQCGNVFYFGVQRQESEVDVVSKQFPIIEVERPATPEADSPCKSPLSEHSEDYAHEAAMDELYLPELADRPCSVMSENTEIKLVEEEIAAVLSGESEVLKEHAVLGLFPKPGVCMTSDVLKTLNEEAIKTKAEKDKDSKKWTTFLQKPNRPIPKSPLQIEAERRKANAYQVQIIRARTPERSVSPCVEKPVEPVPEPEPAKEPTPEPEIEEPPPTDSEVPNLEETLPNDANIEEQIEEVPLDAVAAAEENKINKEKKNSQENKSTDEENVYTVEEAGSDNQKKNEPEPIKTEEELALERQLADVQKQLAALASLPSTIQATLDAVTKQLANLLPAIKLQTELQPQKTETEVAHEISLEKIDESQEEVAIKEDVAVTNEVAENKREDMQEPLEGNEQEADDWNDTEVESLDPVKKHDAMIEKAETRQMEEEQNMKKQKRHDVIEELEEHLERKNNPKRSKRAFGPLVPSSERPLVLPGGRRWYRPKDAYNDEFIAETLSAQAELITGTTLGVNFMKYQKPERRIDLNRSEVYKVIHHLDRQPVRGIEVRPPVVPAEADIRKAVHS